MLKAQYFTLLAVLIWAILGRAQAPLHFYRLQQVHGVWWLQSPQGALTIARGLNGIRLITPSAPRTDLAPFYVDQRTAALIVAMRRSGFNVVGSGSDAEMWHRGLPYVESLQLSSQLSAEQQNGVMDVYAPGFASQVQDLVEVAVRPRLRDPSLLGYFSDDGLAWAPNQEPETVLDTYLGLPWSKPGRAAAVDFLRLRYASNIVALRRSWGVKANDFTTAVPPPRATAAYRADAAGFAAQVLARYLGMVTAAIHRDDPRHLFLGAKLSLARHNNLGSIWSTADVASVRLAPGQNAAAVAGVLAQRTARPIWIEIEGCGAPPPSRDAMLANPQVIGYSWNPGGDWQSGACAAAVETIWAPLNRRGHN